MKRVVDEKDSGVDRNRRAMRERFAVVDVVDFRGRG